MECGLESATNDETDSFFSAIGDNSLSFNGNVDLAKEFSDKESYDMFVTNGLIIPDSKNDEYHYPDTLTDSDYKQEDDTGSSYTDTYSAVEDQEILKNDLIVPSNLGNDYNYLLNPSFNTKHRHTSDTDNKEITNRIMKSTRIIIKPTNIFQRPGEARLTFLPRSIKLFQEFWNSGDVENMKLLFEDMFTDDVIFHNLTSPPIMGRDKIYSYIVPILQTSPDFYALFSNIKRSGKRLVTCKYNCFGTIPYSGDTEDDKPSPWNFYGTPIEKLDEFHQLQKQKYDTLKSQNKRIKFERKSFWYFGINKEMNKFSKIMSKTSVLEIFEK
jgi:hypothetical protein